MHRILLSYLCFAVSLSCFTQTDFLFDESKLKVVRLKLNTTESEFAPFVDGKSFYYTSSQERKVGVINMDASTQHQLLDLYSGTLSDSLTITKIKPLNDKINTPLNQGGCFFDKAASKLYYSTNIPCENYPKKYKLAIYSAILQGNEFLSPIAEIILPDTFMAAHPFIYNQKLYFASNLPGGKGKTDIYYAEKLTESWDNSKKWGNFKNCEFINSEENEYFPFVINENEIYFSSNRSGGLGKLDLYKYTSEGKSSVIQNAGAPMNSKEDDFAIYIDEVQETGYFSTNRDDGQDDIYYFRQTWPSFNNCKENVPEDYCYNLSEESTIDKAGVGGFYYEWLFGDGTKQKGLEVKHCFPGPGNYLINLNIIDSLTKSVFMSQATFDLKVDSIVQLKINCLDTVLVDKPFTINTKGTYLPDNKIEGYYYQIGKLKMRGESITHSFSKTGTYGVLSGVVTLNTKTNRKELICATKNIVCVNKETWTGVEERKFNEILASFSYKAFKSDSASWVNLISDNDARMFDKMGLNGKRLIAEVKGMLAAKAGKPVVVEALEPGQNKFYFNPLKIDTVMRLREQEGITFKVHFGTSKVKKDTSFLSSKGLIGIAESIINNEYHYTYGNEKKINEIEKYYQRSLKAGVKNPVVIGYRNNQIIFDQSANIRPATFEETVINAIKDSLLASSPQSFIGNKNNDAVINANEPVSAKKEKQDITAPESKQPEIKNPESKKNENETTSHSGKSEVSVKSTNKKTLVSPDENLNIGTENEFNNLTGVQKKMEYYLQKYGDISMKDLEFRVQVGAFRKRKSYHFPKLAGLGKIENEHLSNGITRMTIGGSFEKLSDAFNFTKKVVQAGQEDAFVSVYYKGKRVYIENLEKKGLYEKGSIPDSEIPAENISFESNTVSSNENIYSHTKEFEARTNIQKKTMMYAKKYGNISADGLEFKVQIAVFKYRKNFDFPQLKNLGEIHVENLGDGLVRITIGGSFKTLGDAFEHNKKTVAAGQTDAFVSVFYKGKRIYVENLEHKGIFVVNKN